VLSVTLGQHSLSCSRKQQPGVTLAGANSNITNHPDPYLTPRRNEGNRFRHAVRTLRKKHAVE
jgi:hypothetical protein